MIPRAAYATLLLLPFAQLLPAHADVVSDQHKAIGNPGFRPEARRMRNTHPDAQWFARAGMGLFIHWGISAVEGKHELSWAMLDGIDWNPNPIKPSEYFKLAERFNPDSYDPDKWLKAAKAAGFTYAVLTARHHDGYALWPSMYGDYSTRTYLGGRDLVRPFVEACRRNGLKVGFYYSMPDWHYNRHYMSFSYKDTGIPGLPAENMNFEPVEAPTKPAGWDDRFRAYLKGQIEELLTAYGKIDLLWFDGSFPDAISLDRIRELQPGIVVNDRQHGSAGDYRTVESQVPEKSPGEPWELCFGMNNAWGYTVDENVNPAAFLLRRLAIARSWGGNILANFAPRPNGQMTDRYYERMKEIGDWMRHSGKSIFGVGPGPYPELSNVPVTVRGNTWYLHLLPQTQDGPASGNQIAIRTDRNPSSARLLRTGQKIEFHRDGDRLLIDVPEDLRTQLVDVVEIR